MRPLLLALIALAAAACGVPCPTPLAQRCGSPTKVQTCGTDRTWSETRDCTQVLPTARQWTCCRPAGAPDALLACLPAESCDPSYVVTR